MQNLSSLQGRELERGVESNKADLEAKSVSEAARQLGSEAVKCNILISPLEGEKKFLSELCELRNFREGYKKYKTLDRATECAIVLRSTQMARLKVQIDMVMIFFSSIPELGIKCARQNKMGIYLTGVGVMTMH